MRRANLGSFVGGLVVAVLWVTTSAAEEPWRSLFDGQTLEGWIQKNGTATYRVESGTIVGRTMEGSPNSFLCTEDEFGDFELEFDVKVDDALNSGVQIRSQTRPAEGNEAFGRVNGPQVEIEAGGDQGSLAGYVYGEATDRGWLTPDAKRRPHSSFRNGQWNHFRVVADGPRIQTWIYGQPIGDLIDEPIDQTHPRGFIGLQVHGIAAGAGPYEVAWRNIRIRTSK